MSKVRFTSVRVESRALVVEEGAGIEEGERDRAHAAASIVATSAAMPGPIGDVARERHGSRPAPMPRAASASSSGSRRAVAATMKPRRASSSAVARPIPELAPVTQATPSAGVAR